MLVGGIALNFDGSYRLGAGPRLRDRRRRVRQRVLRQDREVPEVPAGHRGRRQPRVRPRRHLCRHGGAAHRRSGGSSTLVPRQRPADSRRRQPGGAAAGASARDRRSRRSACRRDADWRASRSSRRRRPHRVRRDACAASRSASSSVPLFGAHNVRNALAAHGGRPRGRPVVEDMHARRSGEFQRRAPPAGAARRGARRRRCSTTSRIIRPRFSRRSAPSGWSYPDRRDLGGVRAAVGDVVPARVPGRFRAGVRRVRARTRSILASVFRATLPEDERLSVDELVARPAAAGRHARVHAATSTTIVATIARRGARGRSGRHHVERRLRRHPRQAAGRAAAGRPA